MTTTPNTGNSLGFDALVSGLLRVDPKQMPPKPGKKKAAGKKGVKAQVKKKPAKKSRA